jgi:hypothetical protein
MYSDMERQEDEQVIQDNADDFNRIIEAKFEGNGPQQTYCKELLGRLVEAMKGDDKC